MRCLILRVVVTDFSSDDGLTRNYVGGAGTYRSWTHKFGTLFAMTAGSANATQFPMMVHRLWWSAFPAGLLCFSLLFVAFPVMRLESNLAQFVGDGNRGIFSTVPLFFGIGYALTAYALSHVVANTLALADALALLMSLTKSFDWHHDCPGGWMTRNFSCYAIRPGSVPCKLARDDLTDTFRHDTTSEGIPVSRGNKVILIPSEQYKDEATGCIPDLPDRAAPYHFSLHVAVDRQSGSQVQSTPFWAEPVFAIAVIWLLVFAITHKGFLKLKAFFYAIVLLHIVTTLMLLARASTLNGASWGPSTVLSCQLVVTYKLGGIYYSDVDPLWMRESSETSSCNVPPCETNID
ncbi:hypothetical protein MRX96_051688 [Rhipicephalus microplus]